MRIAITGGPQTGKTTLAATLGAPVIHGDDFIELGWSQSSQALAHAMRTRGRGFAEGVQVPRALRKMLEARPAREADRPTDRARHAAQGPIRGPTPDGARSRHRAGRSVAAPAGLGVEIEKR